MAFYMADHGIAKDSFTATTSHGRIVSELFQLYQCIFLFLPVLFAEYVVTLGCPPSQKQWQMKV